MSGTGIRVVRSYDSWESPCVGTDLPYDFVPVPLEQERLAAKPERPVTHDGANADQRELLSGELRCTLTTLSPTLVGNQQVVLADLEGGNRESIEKQSVVSYSDLDKEFEAQLQRLQHAARDDRRVRLDREEPELRAALNKLRNDHGEKKALFPLMLRGSEGAVLIPGESLKGMFRQSFGALTGSPIERIDDATYSYRPNANVRQGTSVAAQVVDVDCDKLLMRVRIITNLSAIEFVKGRPLRNGDRPVRFGETLPRGTRIAKQRREAKGRISWDDDRNPGSVAEIDADRLCLRYHFGMDHGRHFMQAAGKGRGREHPCVLVSNPHKAIRESAITIDPAVVRQYLDTQAHLRDAEIGHLSRNGSKEDRKKVVPPKLEVNDVIFCEWLEAAGGGKGQVISFGHNFRYRWRHLDTPLTRAARFDGNRWVTEPRPEVAAHADEGPASASGGTAGPPDKLTAVRNLLGYVVTAKAGTSPSAFGRLSQLRDPFNRMAGRVSFNMAIEWDEEDPPEQRFVNGGAGKAMTFLHPTASPKASFSRAYVPGASTSWGDGIVREEANGLTIYRLQNGATRLAGRKFYLHQGKLLPNGLLEVPAEHYDLGRLVAKAGADGRVAKCAFGRWDLVQQLWNQQSAVAFRISREGRRFGFAVRFKDLRRHELAAVVAVLQPEYLAQAIVEHASERLPLAREYACSHLPDASGRPCFGHKVGHGRALGMGSVRIQIDAARLRSGDAPLGKKNLQEIIGSLLPRLHDESALQWLKVHSLHPYRVARPYLLHRDATEVPKKIVDWARTESQARFNGGVADARPRRR